MTSEKPRRILHVITGLEDGGAEAVLHRLVTNDTGNEHYVVSLSTRGKYASLLEQAGIEVEALGMRAGRPSPIHLVRLVRMIRQQRPDVVQTWMYHADLFGGVAARLAGVRRVFWGLHNGTLDLKTSRKNTIFISRVNGLLSRFVPTRIISCSQNAAEAHKALGYKAEKFRVVPNGYSLSEYAPDQEQRKAIRQELAIEGDMPVLGMVARFDPQKDHMTLLSALALLKERGMSYRCLLVGNDLISENLKIVEEIDQRGLQNEIILLGRRNDIPSIMNALDVHILSSYGEAFPNVLCEAMACGTPCVSTDVGDASLIVAETGWLVPPQTPDLLANAIYDALVQMKHSPESFEMRRLEAQKRILNHFSVERMVLAYRNIWTYFASNKKAILQE